MRKYRAENPKAARKYQRYYYESHIEELRRKARDYYAARREQNPGEMPDAADDTAHRPGTPTDAGDAASPGRPFPG
jgi:hypothetical protein